MEFATSIMLNPAYMIRNIKENMRCDRELVTRGDRVMTTKQYEDEQLDWKEMAAGIKN